MDLGLGGGKGKGKGKVTKPILFRPKTLDPLICIYGEGSSGKTSEIFKLVNLGYNLTYLDLNHKPQFDLLPEELWGRVNYIKLKNTPGVDNISQTINALSTVGAAEICAEHGAKSCTACSNGRGVTFALNLKNIRDTVLVIDEATTYVDLQLENSLEECTTGQAMEEFAILSGKMAKFYNFLNKIPTPTILVAHEVAVGAKPLDKNPKEGVLYPNLGSSVKSKDVGTPIFSQVIRTLKKSGGDIGTSRAVQYKRTGKAFANTGALESKISNLPLHQALDVIMAGKGKKVEEEAEA